jgi:YVTN family beta-propeller protein
MKSFQLKNLLFAVTIVSVLSACHKDKVEPTPPETTAERAGIYVLNQGNANANNSTLTYYNYLTKATVADQFSAVNSTKIGDTGNDVKIYGSKMYIVVNISSTVEVVDAKTTKSIKQIKMLNGTTARQPRYVIFNKNKAFISSFDGTVAVMDTATLTIEKYITVGRNPEQMAISNGKLYVANSGGLSFGNPDNTVSVIDLNSLTEIKKITVISNPISVAADSYGNVYVLSAGDYYKILPGMTIIDNNTDAVKSQSTTLAGAYGTSIIVSGDNAFFIGSDNKVVVYNVKTQTVAKANFITDGTVITSPYSIAYDSTTGEIFVADAKDYGSNGQLFAFDKNGTLEKDKGYPVATGINPGAIVFVNK